MLPEPLRRAAESWKGGPFEGRVHLVGGAVRDELLGRAREKDFDIVVEGDALAAAQALWREGAAEGPPVVYSRFGTAMVRIGGVDLELASARRESYDPSSRKPKVETGATLAEDALRRDFTVNALLKSLSTGEVIDPTGMGLADLRSGILRTPREPDQTFSDDPLRMLRAIRFSVRLGFRLAEGLDEAIRRNALRLEIVSAERIRGELVQMSAGSDFARALQMMLDLGLLAAFAPELAALKGVEQGDWHDRDVWDHTLGVVGALSADAQETLKWAALLHDVGKPATWARVDGKIRFFRHESVGAEMAAAMLRRLAWSHAEADRIGRLVGGHMRLSGALPLSPSAARRLLRDFGDDSGLLLDLIEADASALAPGVRKLDLAPVRAALDAARREAEAAPLGSPLTGAEIMAAFGWDPGPEVGRIKALLEEEVMEGRIAPGDREAAEEWLRAHPSAWNLRTKREPRGSGA
jgi:poly(A) polymerase